MNDTFGIEMRFRPEGRCHADTRICDSAPNGATTCQPGATPQDSVSKDVPSPNGAKQIQDNRQTAGG